MTDRRSIPDPTLSRENTPAAIARPVVDLRRSAGGARDRQLLMGDKVAVLGRGAGYAHVRVEKDGYHGFVLQDVLGPSSEATHRISAASSHAYTQADIKSPDLLALSFGSRVSALRESSDFIETELGYIPKQHVRPADSTERDPVEVARLFLETPYLWGGNSRWGIDCSGLVQAAFLACGIACPGDSDQQQEHFGAPLPDGTPRKAGDLLFWHGHVALVLDGRSLIHANAHHMATRIEDMQAAMARIEKQGLLLLAHVRP
ncbi:C40 family peptidase [Sediminimonas qiaohouensis]|uniref:C40 family peptidase n=1 Tax=Sediminimonas qiaohouensis TaxID=552061 RepID=UPI00047E1ECC|nr:NlpC/P60 family protein [Sediminimonas qiaohouensis]